MRFLVDECVGPSVVRWLRENNHDASSAFEDCRGWEDERILEKACIEGRIVVTMDKDFGDMIFRPAPMRQQLLLRRLEGSIVRF